MNDFEFSLAKISDVPEILQLYRSLIGTPGCTWSEDYPNTEIAEQDINNGSLYILRADGDIVAAASMSADFGDNLSSLGWYSSKPCEMARLGVSPSLQGRGIGAHMMRMLAQAARDRGFDGMIMLATKQSTSAYSLSKKLGYFQHDDVTLYDVRFLRFELVL